MKLIPVPLFVLVLLLNVCWPPMLWAKATRLGIGAEGLYAQDNAGFLWGVSRTRGDAQKVVRFSGKRGQFKAKVFSSSFLPNLRAKGSTIAHKKDGYIDNIWPLPDGSVLFAAGINGKNYLYKLNPKTNTVGNNKPSKKKPGFNNKQAVMNIGQRGRVHYEDIRALHQRSLLIANYKKKRPVLFFGEYNNADKRVQGRLKNQVILWKSTDMGNNWSKVISWNNKEHQTDHIHGLKQNPYNGWIYILLGDDNHEPGIIAWDGQSLAPPNDTPIADMGRYEGWKALAGSQTVRTGDIVFTKDKCIWLPDIDALTNLSASGESVLRSQQANHDLTNQQAGGVVPYTNHIPPILGYIDADDTIYWASFTSAAAEERKLHFWQSADLGTTWSRSKLAIYNDWTSVPTNLFVTPWGELVLSSRTALLIKNKRTSTGYSTYFKRTPVR